MPWVVPWVVGHTSGADFDDHTPAIREETSSAEMGPGAKIGD